MNAWLNFFVDALAFGAVFIYGSTGEIITEKVGHLNLGIPGIMCMGGAGGCLFLQFFAKTLPGFLLVPFATIASFLMAALMGLIYSFMTVTLRANQNVTGLAMTTFGSGLMMTIMSRLKATVYLNKPKKMFRFPFAARTDSLQRIGVLFFLAIAVAIAASYVLYKTKLGLHLRSVGENPATADAVGINVTKYKYLATCIGSGIAGLGGFYYIIDYMGSQEAYKSIEAFGWLAIALVIFALWRPHVTIAGSFVFGVLFCCSSSISVIASKVSWLKVTMSTTPLLKMLPYIVTIVVLVLSSIRNKRENQPPAALGVSYFREDR